MWYYEALEDVTAVSGNIIKKGEIIRIGGLRGVKMGTPLEEWQVLSVVDAEGSEYDLMKLVEVKDKFKVLYAVEEKYELEFNYDKAVELAKPLMHYLSETGHTEVISVCKEGISAIPMGTFLYKG